MRIEDFFLTVCQQVIRIMRPRFSMPMGLTHNDALGDQRLRGVERGQWPTGLLLRGESVLVLAREMATTVRESVRRWSSEIRVSPMSLTWLRMHECEDDKHCKDP